MTLILLPGQQLSAKHNFQNEGANTLLDETVKTIRRKQWWKQEKFIDAISLVIACTTQQCLSWPVMLLPLSATNGHNSLSLFCPKFLCEADVACPTYHFAINPLKSGKTERG